MGLFLRRQGASRGGVRQLQVPTPDPLPSALSVSEFAPDVERQDTSDTAAKEQSTNPSDADVFAAVKALDRVLGELDTAGKLLAEVYSIGLWSKADDSSDNRRKRQGLREADWAASGAYRVLSMLSLEELPDAGAKVRLLTHDLRDLVATLESLPDTVTDTMGDSLALDAAIADLQQYVAILYERASQLSAEYRERATRKISTPPN